MPAPYANARAIQQAFLDKLRDDSCLDPRVPLSGFPASRPESGPSVERYYAWKHSAGPGPGRFYPLHELAFNRVYHAEK